MFDTEEGVHHFETFLSFGVVYTAYVHNRFKLTLRMVAEEGENGDDGGRSNVESEFILENGELLDEFRETLGEVGPKCMKRLCRFSILSDSRVRRR